MSERAQHADDVAQDGRSGRHAAGAGASQDERTRVAREDLDDVLRIRRARELVLFGHENGRDVGQNSVRRTQSSRDEPNPVTEHPRARDVALRHFGDSASPDALRDDREAKGHLGDDGELVRGVDAADVVGGIGLGVTTSLRLRERVAERGAALHRGQNRRTGTVDDAGDTEDFVACKRLIERAQNRYRAADRRFESQRGASRRRKRRQARSLFADQIFVRGDDVPPAFQRVLDEFRSLRRSADDLDDQVDLRIVDDRTGVPREESPLERVRAFFERIGDRDGAKLVTNAAPAFDCIALPVQTVGHVRADRSAPEEPDPHSRFHVSRPPVSMGKRG